MISKQLFNFSKTEDRKTLMHDFDEDSRSLSFGKLGYVAESFKMSSMQLQINEEERSESKNDAEKDNTVKSADNQTESSSYWYAPPSEEFNRSFENVVADINSIRIGDGKSEDIEEDDDDDEADINKGEGKECSDENDHGEEESKRCCDNDLPKSETNLLTKVAKLKRVSVAMKGLKKIKKHVQESMLVENKEENVKRSAEISISSIRDRNNNKDATKEGEEGEDTINNSKRDIETSDNDNIDHGDVSKRLDEQTSETNLLTKVATLKRVSVAFKGLKKIKKQVKDCILEGQESVKNLGLVQVQEEEEENEDEKDKKNLIKKQSSEVQSFFDNYHNHQDESHSGYCSGDDFTTSQRDGDDLTFLDETETQNSDDNDDDFIGSMPRHSMTASKMRQSIYRRGGGGGRVSMVVAERRNKVDNNIRGSGSEGARRRRTSLSPLPMRSSSSSNKIAAKSRRKSLSPVRTRSGSSSNHRTKTHSPQPPTNRHQPSRDNSQTTRNNGKPLSKSSHHGSSAIPRQSTRPKSRGSGGGKSPMRNRQSSKKPGSNTIPRQSTRNETTRRTRSQKDQEPQIISAELSSDDVGDNGDQSGYGSSTSPGPNSAPNPLPRSSARDKARGNSERRTTRCSAERESQQSAKGQRISFAATTQAATAATTTTKNVRSNHRQSIRKSVRRQSELRSGGNSSGTTRGSNIMSAPITEEENEEHIVNGRNSHHSSISSSVAATRSGSDNGSGSRRRPRNTTATTTTTTNRNKHEPIVQNSGWSRIQNNDIDGKGIGGMLTQSDHGTGRFRNSLNDNNRHRDSKQGGGGTLGGSSSIHRSRTNKHNQNNGKIDTNFDGKHLSRDIITIDNKKEKKVNFSNECGDNNNDEKMNALLESLERRSKCVSGSGNNSKTKNKKKDRKSMSLAPTRRTDLTKPSGLIQGLDLIDSPASSSKIMKRGSDYSNKDLGRLISSIEDRWEKSGDSKEFTLPSSAKEMKDDRPSLFRSMSDDCLISTIKLSEATSAGF